jgi:hypothetical protein
MGKLTLWGAGAIILFGVFVGYNQQQANAQSELEAVKQRFIGNYDLVRYVTIAEDGQEIDRNYIGRIMYDAYGNMAAQGMPRDLPERARRSSENLQEGFAYWGAVSYDIDKNIVIHHVEGSPTRGTWPGVDNVRYFEFTDDYLILSVRNDEGRTTARLTWEKYQ